MNFRILEQANEELDEAAGHYALEYEGRARRFLLAYGETVELAMAFPSAAAAIGHSGTYGLRAFHLHHFPYTVFAAVSDQEFVVLAVAHDKRRPGYWADRLDEVSP